MSTRLTSSHVRWLAGEKEEKLGVGARGLVWGIDGGTQFLTLAFSGTAMWPSSHLTFLIISFLLV